MPPKKKQSQAWKGAEKQIAQILRDVGIPAERLTRAGDWSQKDYEVHVEGTGHFLKIDSKYTQAKPFRHHSLMREIQFKYCKKTGDEAVLFTKNYKEHSGFVTIRAEFFAEILKDHLDRLGRDYVIGALLPPDPKIGSVIEALKETKDGRD